MRTEGKKMNNAITFVRKRLFGNVGGIVIAFILLCVGLSIASPFFLSVENLMIGARQAIFVLIIGFAMTFVISLAGIDLPVAASLALPGVFAAKMPPRV